MRKKWKILRILILPMAFNKYVLTYYMYKQLLKTHVFSQLNINVVV